MLPPNQAGSAQPWNTGPSGRSGLKVSPLCLGAMMFGGQTDDDGVAAHHRAGARAGRELHRHRRCLQRRPVRGGGRPRHRRRARLVGAGHQDRQPDGRPGRTRAAPRGCTPSAPWRRACAGCGTDAIDVLYLHKEDHDTPLDETVRAIADLVRAGKLRHFGVSNYPRLAGGRDLPARRRGRHRPAGGQPAAVQRAEPHGGDRASAGLRASRGRRVPLFAAGARRADRQIRARRSRRRAGTRAGRQDRRIMETEWRAESLHIAGTLAERAQARGRHAGAVRARLGAEQPAGHRRDHRPAHLGRSGRSMPARWRSGWMPRTRRWWTGWLRPAIRPRRATTIRPIRWKGGRRAGKPPPLQHRQRALARRRLVGVVDLVQVLHRERQTGGGRILGHMRRIA